MERAGDGGSREADQTLIEFLRQIDGFETGQEPGVSEKLLTDAWPHRRSRSNTR